MKEGSAALIQPKTLADPANLYIIFIIYIPGDVFGRGENDGKVEYVPHKWCGGIRWATDITGNTLEPNVHSKMLV